MEIIDYNYRKPNYLEKNITENIDTIVIHHTSNNNSLKINTDYHIDNLGWNWCGYAYYISNGVVYKIRGIEYKNANSRGHNHHTIGIAIQGDYENDIPSETDINLVIELIKELKEKYPHIKYIKGHKEFNNTTCPGKNINVQLIRERTKRETINYNDIMQENELLKRNNIELIAEVEKLDKIIRKDRKKYDDLKEIYQGKVKELQELRDK
jgi:N-acetylmuramoyl-L-alanine amidase